MSYFGARSLAEGYARSRPYFHPLVVDRISAYLALEQPVRRALDVGCGAGLSTIALCKIARAVVGVDSAAAMIATALPHTQARYAIAPAERLPFAAASFDLITVCGALNWIDRDAFFPAAKGVLKSAGWLIVYDNLFNGQMRENPTFADWYAQDFLARYPKPPRDERAVSADEAARYGFSFAHAETYTNEIAYRQSEYIEYMATQSNIAAAVLAGRETAAEARAWLARALAPFFGARQRTLLYGGYIWYLQAS